MTSLLSARSSILEQGTTMHCLNKFLISSTPISLCQPPNSQSQSSAFLPNLRTRKNFRSPNAYRGIDGEISSEKILPLSPDVRTITSTSNAFVKHCVKLRQSSSYRHFHGSVLVVGETLIREIFSFRKTIQDKPVIECLLVLDENYILEGLDDTCVHTVLINSAVMSKLSGVQSIDSIKAVALMKIPSTFQVSNYNLNEEDCSEWFSIPHRILVLDGIQDPGNLGTLIRSATAFNWGGIFLLPCCCDPFNEKALRASRGACFQIQIVSGSWSHVETLREEFRMKMLAGHPAISDKPTKAFTLSIDFVASLAELPLCLVLGSEGSGLSESSRNACELVSIPMAGDFESLNVSVAGGIFMYMLQHKK